MTRPGPTVLLLSGYTGSGPQHWATLWRLEHGYVAVEQRDWDDPDPVEWEAAFAAAFARTEGAVVLAGHSLGCLVIARWAERHDVSRVAGALLVAPCDVEAPGAIAELRRFAPMPSARLPFPSRVVASTNDPLATLERSRAFAVAWGSELTVVDGAGHFDTAAGYGPWPAGHGLLRELFPGA